MEDISSQLFIYFFPNSGLENFIESWLTLFSLKSCDIFYIIFILNCLLLLFRLKKMLIILFAFEFMVVNVLFAFVFLRVPFDSITLLVFLAVVAGEARLGLRLLVSVLRQRGNDNILLPSLTSFEGF